MEAGLAVEEVGFCGSINAWVGMLVSVLLFVADVLDGRGLSKVNVNVWIPGVVVVAPVALSSFD